MAAYYNEIDPNAAEWLRQLIKAGQITDGEVDERSIEDVTPSDVAGFKRVHWFAGIAGWEYALRLAGWPDDRPVWTGSAPCFVAGTLILTDSGLKPIESIVVGERVLTHTGRFMPVLSVMSSYKETVIVKGQGVSQIETTAEHPFYARKAFRDNKRASASYGKKIMSDPQWVEAKDLAGLRWSMPSTIPAVTMPEVKSFNAGVTFDRSCGRYRAKAYVNGCPQWVGSSKSREEALAFRKSAAKLEGFQEVENLPDSIESLEFAQFLGYWLGDGWTTNQSKDPGKVRLCGAKADADLIARLAKDAGLTGYGSIEKTSARFTIGSKSLADWLDANFGYGAGNKFIPTWLYGMPDNFCSAFLDGLLLADGCKWTQQKGGGAVRQLTTKSKKLAIGVRILMNRLGKSASIQWNKGRNNHEIDGRKVNDSGHYQVIEYATARSYVDDGLHGWSTVRSVTPTGQAKPVFNIEVEGDNSYVADGIVVHNCQPFSAAGKGKGFDDERHLWPAFFWLISQCRPETVFGEQVASKDGLGWWDVVSADLERADYACGAFDLCAPGVGAFHIRQRLYWVANTDSPGRQWAGQTQSEGWRCHPVPAGGEQADGLADSELRGCQRESKLSSSRPQQTMDSSARIGISVSSHGSGSSTMADSQCPERGPITPGGKGEQHGAIGERQAPSGSANGGETGPLANPSSQRRQQDPRSPLSHEAADGRTGRHGGEPNPDHQPSGDGENGGTVDHPSSGRFQGGWAGVLQSSHEPNQRDILERTSGSANPWADPIWLPCADGKTRPVEPSIQPLVNGLPRGVGYSGDPCVQTAQNTAEGRVMRLKGYGNAIVPQLAAEFVSACMESFG